MLEKLNARKIEEMQKKKLGEASPRSATIPSQKTMGSSNSTVTLQTNKKPRTLRTSHRARDQPFYTPVKVNVKETCVLPSLNMSSYIKDIEPSSPTGMTMSNSTQIHSWIARRELSKRNEVRTSKGNPLIRSHYRERYRDAIVGTKSTGQPIRAQLEAKETPVKKKFSYLLWMERTMTSGPHKQPVTSHSPVKAAVPRRRPVSLGVFGACFNNERSPGDAAAHQSSRRESLMRVRKLSGLERKPMPDEPKPDVPTQFKLAGFQLHHRSLSHLLKRRNESRQKQRSPAREREVKETATPFVDRFAGIVYLNYKPLLMT
jgi:hypothetical protein